MTAPDLKPCPFCGGEARKWQDPSHSAAWFIGCDDGDRDCFGSIHWAETEAEAIAAWNRRATDQATLAALPEGQVLIAAAYEAAASMIERHRDYGMIGPDGDWLAGEAEVLAHGHSLHYAMCDVSALTPADAIAAREARDAQMRAEGRVAGLREAAKLLRERAYDWEEAGLHTAAIRALADKIENGANDPASNT